MQVTCEGKVVGDGERYRGRTGILAEQLRLDADCHRPGAALGIAETGWRERVSSGQAADILRGVSWGIAVAASGCHTDAGSTTKAMTVGGIRGATIPTILRSVVVDAGVFLMALQSFTNSIPRLAEGASEQIGCLAVAAPGNQRASRIVQANDAAFAAGRCRRRRCRSHRHHLRDRE